MRLKIEPCQVPSEHGHQAAKVIAKNTMWEMKDASELNTALNFRPVTPWPAALPAISLNNLMIAGFDRTSGPALVRLDPSNQALSELLRACYPKLLLAEGARLIHQLNSLNFSIDSIWNLMGLKPSADHLRIFKLIIVLPVKVQNWIDERQLSPRDLSILLCFDSLEPLAPTLNLLAQRNLSRNLGAQILELSGELALMDQALPAPYSFERDPDGRAWLAELEKQRRPRSSARDESRREELQSLPWPQQLKGQWRRQGDQSRLEVSLSAGSLQEWNRRLEDLSKMTPLLGQASLWKN